MDAEQIKQQLGELMADVSEENFRKGYDPISEYISHVEAENETYVKTEKMIEDYYEEFCKIIDYASKLDFRSIDYERIYYLDCFGQFWYYSKKFDDLYYEEWKRNNVSLTSNRNSFYYFLHRKISRQIDLVPELQNWIKEDATQFKSLLNEKIKTIIYGN